MKNHPAWYGSVMATGATALVLSVQAATWGWHWLEWVARIFLFLASVLAVVLLPRYLRRFGDRVALTVEIGDAANGAMLATLPAGLLILATAWGRVGPAPAGLWIDTVLLVLGTVVALVLGLVWSTAVMRGNHGLEAVNGGWLIPPVMNLLVPLALSPLIVEAGGAAPLLMVVGFAFYGIGVVLFLAMMTLFIARLAFREPPPAGMAPMQFIPLAAAGLTGLALLELLRAGVQAGVPDVGFHAGIWVAAMGLGFGLWWAVFAWLEFRRARPPVHPGWWGLVFPVAAMTLSLANLGLDTNMVVLQVAGALATVVLLGVWGMVAARTAGMLRT